MIRIEGARAACFLNSEKRRDCSITKRSGHGVLATFALETVPEYDRIIERATASLSPGGRLALLGLKHPARWPDWLVEMGIWLNRPFGVSRDYAALRPWESVRRRRSTSVEPIDRGGTCNV